MKDPETKAPLSQQAIQEQLLLDYRARGAEALVEGIAKLQAADARSDEIGRMRRRLDAQQRRIDILEHVLHALSGLPPAADVQLATRVSIDAFSPLAEESGFYKLEYERRGNAYRWTGARTAFSFVLGLDRSQDRLLSLALFTFSLQDREKVRGWIDGTPIEWKEITRSSICTNFTFEVPSGGSGGATSLVFEPDRLWFPKDVNADSKDARRLGVAFHSLVSI